MMEEFPLFALLATLGVAGVAGPIGCVLLWKRMAYFGDALAHSALLGLALGILLGLDPAAGAFWVALGLALILMLLQQVSRLANDTLLGILAHATLAFGLLALALHEAHEEDIGEPHDLLASGHGHELMEALFGNVMAVSMVDLIIIWGVGVLGLAALAVIWRGLVAATLHPDLARAEGVAVKRCQLVYMVLVAAVVAIGLQVVGALLIISLAIIPAAAARPLVRTPEQMAVLAGVFGGLSAGVGLLGAWWLHWPPGPSIVVAATGLFAFSLIAWRRSA